MDLRTILPLALVIGCCAGTSQAQFSDFHGYTGFDGGTSDRVQFLTAMRLADLDGDGHDDLLSVSEHFFYCRLVVLMNRGDNTFGEPQYHALMYGARDLVAADLDGDGDLDVAVPEGGDSGRGLTVAVFRNDGGRLLLGQRLASLQGPQGIAAADFDGDGDADLALAIRGPNSQDSRVQLLSNDGTGQFTAGPGIQVFRTPYKLEAGDLDGDGRPDLAIAHEVDDAVSVLMNSATGLGAPQTLLVNTGQGSQIYCCLKLVDIDRDGDLDIAYSDRNHSVQIGSLLRAVVSIVENQGGGSFAVGPHIQLQGGAGSYIGMAFDDLNGDGWPDVVGVDGRAWSYVLSDGQGGFLIPSGISYGELAGDQPFDVLTLDADRDGDPDALILNKTSSSFSVHRFENGAPLVPVSSPPGTWGPGGDVDAADVDGDGDLDIAGGRNGPVFVSKNRGDGTFDPPDNYNTHSINGTKAVVLRDLDGDGSPDLLWTTLSGFGVRFNSGTGTFSAATLWAVGSCGNVDIDAFDMDHDGDLDVFAVEGLGCPSQPTSTRRIFVSRNQGTGSFDPPYVVLATLQNSTIAHGDVDSDGNLDFVVGNNTWLDVHLGRGDGSFLAPIVVPADFSPREIVIADLNGDGVQDLASANWGDLNDDTIEETLTVILGLGGGGFAPAQTYPASYSPTLGGTSSLAAGDVDRDGDLDLMVSNYGSGEVSLYRNHGDGTFASHVRIGGAFQMTDLLFGDFDGDGIGDIAAAGQAATTGSTPKIVFLRGLGGDPWTDLGGGLRGARGVPYLDCDGAVVTGGAIDVEIYRAAAGAPAICILGLTRVDLPLLGGTLVPSPDVLLPFGTDQAGEASLSVPVSAQVPRGLQLLLQAWILDAAGAQGLAATNATRAAIR